MRSTQHQPRFQHPQLAVVWPAIDALDPGLQYELLRELATDFAFARRGSHQQVEGVRAGIQALHTAAVVLGRPPSVKVYRRLRAERPDLDLPPDASVRRWLGGTWNAALERALLDAVPEGGFLSRASGSTERFTKVEMLEALKQCTADLGHAPSMTEYPMWAKRPDIDARPGRRPLSTGPFARLGGWHRALVQAGVLSPESLENPLDRRPLPRRYAYTAEEVRAAVLRVAHRLKRAPSQAEYWMERERIAEETTEAGDALLLPTPNVVRRHFGSWDSALSEAGLAPLRRSNPYAGKKRPTYSQDEKLRWLERAWSEVGDPFTTMAYARWRQALVATGICVPSLSAMKDAFGTWRAAVAAAIPPDPDRRKTGRDW